MLRWNIRIKYTFLKANYSTSKSRSFFKGNFNLLCIDSPTKTKSRVTARNSFPTYQSQVLRWLCNKYCCYVTAHGTQHVGSRDSNVQSPALFFAVKSSIIMESYHNVTIYSAGKCTLLLKILKTAFSSQRFAVHREKRMNLFLFTRRWINSKSQQYCRCHPRACA